MRNRPRHRTSSPPLPVAQDRRRPAAYGTAASRSPWRDGRHRTPGWSPGTAPSETPPPGRNGRDTRHRAHRLAPSETRRREWGQDRASFALSGPLGTAPGLRLDDRKLQLALRRIHTIERHAQPIADRELPTSALPHDLAHTLVIRVAVARQRVEGHQPLDE